MLFEKEVFSATLHKGMNIAAGTMTMWRRIEFVLLLFFCAYANVLLVTLTIFAMLCKRAYYDTCFECCQSIFCSNTDVTMRLDIALCLRMG